MFEHEGVRYAKPTEWSDAVIACEVVRARRIGDELAAKVCPLIKARYGSRPTTRDRQQRDGWAVWRGDGTFARWGDREWADLVPLAGDVLVVVYRKNTVQRLAWPDLAVRDSLAFTLPQQGIEELVVAPSQQRGLAYLSSGQGEGGYELFDVRPLRRSEGAPGFTLPCLYSPPQFSPDERHVVAAIGARAAGYNWKYNTGWWLSDEQRAEGDEDGTSQGGAMPFAQVLVHDLADGAIRKHRVDLALPPGWAPPDDSMDWDLPELLMVGSDAIELGFGRELIIELSWPLRGDMTSLPLGELRSISKV
jgi:hypothetical protein